ncbi:MAG: RluA family pseudouridine synthase [Lachnospiraceae bacterium]|nr:RluA family pseudouridine synthase [Lachnospiraceae bacterium]
MKTKILYEDQDILVIYKPAGIATQTAKIGQADVVSELRGYLAKSRRGNDKGGAIPFVGLVHRLDQPVEGVLVFGKHKKATAQLNGQLADGRMKKFYLAAVCGKPSQESAKLVDYVVKDKDGLAKIVKEGHPEAKKAVLEYTVKGTCALQVGARHDVENLWNRDIEVSLVEILLKTGRFHQIRVQMSSRGNSLLGDSKYGSEISALISNSLNIRNAALCAYHLEFEHPMTGKKLEYTVSPENKAFTIFQNYLA